MTPEETLAVKDALNGKLSDDYNDLEKLVQNLTAKKAITTDHGTFKHIDKALSKVQAKMSKLKA